MELKNNVMKTKSAVITADNKDALMTNRYGRFDGIKVDFIRDIDNNRSNH